MEESAMSQERDFLHPTAECDLVMKGGITSGIVYPPAVLELAPRYRFRDIGGASAGAIAAALVAAAEYGREDGGFDRLREVNHHLAEPKHLLELFQPTRAARPAFAALMALMKGSTEPPPAAGARETPLSEAVWTWLQRAWAVLTTYGDHDRIATGGPALVPGVIVFLLVHLALRQLGAAVDVANVVGLAAGFLAWVASFAIIALVRLVFVLWGHVPENSFGMCTGLTDGGEGPGLVDWLSGELDRVAGRASGDAPLTISDLASRGIRLQTVTTNLSVAQPQLLPFDREFIFSRTEMSTVFPRRIVDHLWSKGRSVDGAGFGDYRFLPPAGDLPVILCARLSLSFPVLISAVPLWTLPGAGPQGVAGGAKPADLQRHWFSDGGISSNFPIHFFDHWLPTRPTFGIDLTEMPDQAFDAAASDGLGRGPDGAGPRRLKERYFMAPDPSEQPGPIPRDDVVLLRPQDPMYPEWSEIRGLFEFLFSIWETTHSYHDNMLMQLPGFRDRVVRVRFATGEGGLNLSMSRTAVNSIRDKGTRAGRRLLDEFAFDDHRWVRLRVLMAELERRMAELATAYRAANYQGLIARSNGKPFSLPHEWRVEAERRMKFLVDLVEEWRRADAEFFGRDEPKPKPLMRMNPRV
jgi:hypothetical protein